MATRAALVFGLAVVVLSVACSSTGGDEAAADPAAGDPALGGTTSPDGTTGPGGSAKICGQGAARPCNADEACGVAADCESAVCTGGKCIAPSGTDGAKNGGETGIDCGGASGKKCAGGEGCKVDADCTSGGCRAGTCAIAKSCRAVSGGGTCGEGEVGDAKAKHEDCCTSIDVPRPADKGGAYRLDKYLVTAGRMRTFIEEVKGDVRGWVAKNTPPGWTTAMNASVPANATDVAQQLGAGQQGATSYGGQLGPGCYAGGMGAPAYWMSDADQSQYNGDIARAYSKDVLDSKVLNCATKALFVAFCHWDGGRLPNDAEWAYAGNGGDAARTYPWGTDTKIGDYASYDFNYSWPAVVGASKDRGAFLPAPGRFPQGKGPFGHMDLAGAVENFTVEGGIMQYSFQEAGKEQFGIAYGKKRTWDPSTKHWAVGARCVRPM
ncbi:MAG: hypothetical protein JWP87_3317 [Labilithrix sp.]|nr:hypothetical protein [Labilithrix sp.]